MATIKNTSNTLGNLLNQINSQPGGFSSSVPTGGFSQPSNISIDADDSIPSMLETQPVFEMNYKSTKKQCIKKAKDQLTVIVKEVVPEVLQDSKMIQDKISQDADWLGALYYEYEKADKVIQALMETIGRGETQARLFEVFTKMSESQQKLSSKITETQNQMRKYYIDTYLDLQQKESADENAIPAIENKSNKAIEAPAETLKEQTPNIIVGTDQTIKLISDRRRQAMIAKYQEAKDAEDSSI